MVRRGSFHRIPAKYSERWVVGVDIGQSMDPTAICVLHHTVTPTNEWTLQERYGLLVSTREKTETHFDVRHLERLPLGTSYVAAADYLVGLLHRPPLRGEADLVIDETGVGRAVGDIFEERGLNPIRVGITAGNEATDHGSSRWHVPKGELISSVDAKLHCGELRFAAELTDAGALAEELKDFQRKVTASGRATFDARGGKHDDLILSVSIALWWAMRPGGAVAVDAPFTGLY